MSDIAAEHAGAGTWLFLAALALWVGCSVLRFCNMYDLSSRVQRFRRYDPFKLVPVGAFFGPEPPPTEFCLLVRDLLERGNFTDWTEVPSLRARRWWHAVWNPQKHLYKARSSAARRLLLVSQQWDGQGPLPPQVVLSNEYFKVLRFASALSRLSAPPALQFAVIERDVLTKAPQRWLISKVHELGALPQ